MNRCDFSTILSVVLFKQWYMAIQSASQSVVQWVCQQANKSFSQSLPLPLCVVPSESTQPRTGCVSPGYVMDIQTPAQSSAVLFRRWMLLTSLNTDHFRLFLHFGIVAMFQTPCNTPGWAQPCSHPVKYIFFYKVCLFWSIIWTMSDCSRALLLRKLW